MPGPPPDFWNARYAEPELAYGDAPNDFLASVADRIGGRILCLAEGQGRNAVFLAQRGLEVVAVDRSEVGLERAQAFAAEHGVEITTQVADLEDYDLGLEAWDAVVSIFAHTSAEIRRSLHRRVVASLRPGGAFVLEAYTPEQTERNTGGPSGPGAVDITMTADGLRSELAGLEVEILRETERDVLEGAYHNGDAAVVQMLAFKPG